MFLTDGLAIDYKPDNHGKDNPFGGDYSSPLKYAGGYGAKFCNRRGWCSGGNVTSLYQVRESGFCGDGVGESAITSLAECESAAAAVSWSDITVGTNSISSTSYPPGCVFYNGQLFFNQKSSSPYTCRTGDKCVCKTVGCNHKPGVDASTCSSANVIRAVKDIPGTTVIGVYVGDRTGYGPQVLHNVSSCDTYTFDPTHPHACPNTFSTDSFASLKTTIIPTVNNLMEEAQRLRGICVACSVGMYSAHDGDKCLNCPVGMYGGDTGLSGCSSCPEYHTSTVTGLTSSSQCKSLCGALNDAQVSAICTSGNGLVPEAMTTALCNGVTCDSSDESTCCLPNAKCSSVSIIGSGGAFLCRWN